MDGGYISVFGPGLVGGLSGQTESFTVVAKSGNLSKYGFFLIWLVGCFGFNGPLRQYFSLYRAVSRREGERGEKGQMRVKMSKQPPSAPTASAVGPCPALLLSEL